MHSISTALAGLCHQLADDIPDVPGLHHLDVSFALNDAFDPLAWLNAQHCFPQFYWQQRNGDEEYAALGATKHFASLSDARHFLHCYPQCPDVRVVGVNAFDPYQGNLFLPRLLWQRSGGTATLRLILCSATSLKNDAQHAHEFLRSLRDSQPVKALNQPVVSETHRPEKSGWLTLITRATDAIARGEFDKVVLARATDLHFNLPVNPVALIAASRRVNFQCYHFLMRPDATRAFLGSSPERLWRRRGTLLRTEALAGTVASHPDDAQAARMGDWLMHDDKNQRENMLVVEDICQRLQRDGGVLDVLPPQIVRLRKVQHLRRCIWTALQQPDDEQCLMRLQPTAAVAGLPRQNAWDFIARNEPFDREWYAGSAGYLSLAQSEFCVALRSARVQETCVRLYAGAGIVSGSDPEQEWQEIENKAAGLRSLLLKD
ncbi:isochorismate synthase MenF [Leclercia adecarboxylata]|uniref:isochorismate synthase MenF n=1 Tax=Leclercia TaxID=83654 RepID=UPI0009809A11|nr:isochorismate synthase MenF [Leclercia adecarboxylata]MDU2021730.1 isochorismate synthase MenF [Leclercia adecarboxylata]OOB86065.1 isochorismate synthase MenF [Leclercia adecarboxylata]